MSERLSPPERHEVHKNQPEERETESRQAEHEPQRQEKRIDIHEARHKAKEALPSDEVRARAEAASKPQHRPSEPVSRQTKQLVYERTLLRLRRRLSPLSRTGSKVIHQRSVEAISEVAGKTVARPSGLLGGGTLAFIGTGAYYYMTRHYGYDYRPMVFLVLLGGGFIVGWLAEASVKMFKRPR